MGDVRERAVRHLLSKAFLGQSGFASLIEIWDKSCCQEANRLVRNRNYVLREGRWETGSLSRVVIRQLEVRRGKHRSEGRAIPLLIHG